MYYSTETCQSWYHIYEYFPYSINWYNKIILELISKSKKDRQHNDQKKKDKQRSAKHYTEN
jgi:hypothetical protein